MLGQAKRLYELNSLFNSKDEDKESTKIISFSSGKGGTGKSFVSSNIAYQMASNGLRVLLIDFDINLSNLGTIFNTNSKKNLYHYFNYDYNLEDVILNYSENLNLILGESGRSDHPELTEEKVNLFLSELNNISHNYDLILIDTASGIDKSTLQILHNSAEVMIVTTSEPTSVMDAYVIVKMLKSNSSKAQINVIINKTFDQNEGQIAFENLEKAVSHFLKIKVKYAGNISFSQEVVKSIQNQTLLVKTEKSPEISTQLEALSSKLSIPTIG